MAIKKKLTTALTITGDTTYTCNSTKNYTDSFSIEQELGNADAFITLSSGSKNPAQASIHNAKAIVIKNVSNIAAEIAILVKSWKNSSSVDIQNPVTDLDGDGTSATNMWSFLLPANDFIYLPNSRVLEYIPQNMTGVDIGSGSLECATKAGVGTVAIEPKDINSGNEYVDIHTLSGTTYFSGSDVQIAEDVAISETEINVQDGSWFKAGDLIMVSSEVMQVESVSGIVLTVKRGLLGSTEATHSDDDDLKFFIGNEYLPFDNGKCMTDKFGRFKQSGAFFCYGRTEDTRVEGLNAGSIAIGPFYTEGGYLDWGLSGITANKSTGLAVSTTYTFHIIVDEFVAAGFDGTSNEVAIAFTTDASDVTFAGSSNAVLPKIQAALDTQAKTTSSGLLNKRVTIGLHNGDVRVQSHSNHSDTIVGIGNVSGTTPFAVGAFPPLASSVPDLLGSPHGGGTTDTIVYGPASTLAQETIDDRETAKTETNTATFIFDNGKGDLLYQDKVVGWIDYTKGHCEWQIPSLPEAEFKIYAESHSAHSGGVSFGNTAENSIQSIRARSINPIKETKVKLILFG